MVEPQLKHRVRSDDDDRSEKHLRIQGVENSPDGGEDLYPDLHLGLRGGDTGSGAPVCDGRNNHDNAHGEFLKQGGSSNKPCKPFETTNDMGLESRTKFVSSADILIKIPSRIS